MSKEKPDLEELAYGATKIPLVSHPGDMFMLADETILANRFEIIASKPMTIKVDGKDVTVVPVIMTFAGVLNNDGRMKSFSMLVLPEMVPNLIKRLRLIYSQIPMEYK